MKLLTCGVALTVMASIILLLSLDNISLYGQPLTNTSTVESTQAEQPSQSQL